MSWSPNWTLRRLIGPSLVSYIGPQTSAYRSAVIREFNNTKSLARHFVSMNRIAKNHVQELVTKDGTANISNIIPHVENFAIALWGDTLYGSHNHHADGRVWALSDVLLKYVSNPWPSIWYSIQLFLKLVKPGDPTRYEAKLRSQVDQMASHNLAKLKSYEYENPDGPLKSVRNLSLLTCGAKTGPLSTLASEFTRLDIFGKFRISSIF